MLRAAAFLFCAIGAVALVGVLLGCAARKPLAGLVWTDETPAWSPDGREIVFGSNRAAPGGGVDHLYTMNADGTEVRRLTRDDVDAREPSFSPDGRRIVYVANRLNRSREYTDAGWIDVISPGRGRPHALTPGLLGDENLPAWSPTGRWIAFIDEVHPNDLLGDRDDLYIVRPNGSALHRLAVDIEGWALSWSPDGTAIAISGPDGRLYRVLVSATRPLRLADRPGPITTDIAWSPDGSKLAFVRGVILPGGSGVTPRYLYVRNLRTRGLYRLREVIDSDSVGDTEVSIVWLRRMHVLLLAVFDGHRTRLLNAHGRGEGTVKTTNWGQLSAGSASPHGRQLLLVDGPSGSYTSAIFAAHIGGELVQLTQLRRAGA
jgi:Tol biopolymer transport system component